MFKLTKGAVLPEARPISFRVLGTGDGETKKFTIPDLPSNSGLIVFVGPWRINRKIELQSGKTLEFKGKVERTKANETAPEVPTSITFDEPIEDGANVVAVLLDCADPDFNLGVLPLTKGVQDLLSRKIEDKKKEAKLGPKDSLPGSDSYRLVFNVLVSSWVGVVDETERALRCTDDEKTWFQSKYDNGTYAMFAQGAAEVFAGEMKGALGN